MGIMLVYDITNQKSFTNVTNWLRNIDQHASEDVVRILVGNKVGIHSQMKDIPLRTTVNSQTMMLKKQQFFAKISFYGCY